MDLQYMCPEKTRERAVDSLAMVRIKVVCIDLFRTLVSCGDPEETILKEFSREIALRHGRPFSRIFPKLYKSFEWYTCAAPFSGKYGYENKLFEGMGLQEGKRFRKRLENAFEKEKRKVHAYKDAIAVLKSLRKKGYKLALVSNNPPFLDDTVEKELRLKKRFDVLTLSSKLHTLKPSPKLFRTALRKLKEKPQEAVMVGDNLYNDILPARRIGMQVILLDRKRKYAIKDKEIIVIRSLKALTKKIENLEKKTMA